MRTTKPLTVADLRQIKPTSKRQSIGDGNSLYLVIAAAVHGRATMAWELRYASPITRRRTSVTLGRYPEMSLQDARKAAVVARAEVQRGLCPAIERKRARAVGKEGVFTLASCVAAWDTSRETSVDAATRQVARRRLERYVLPQLGTRPLSGLVAADFRRALDPIARSGKHETAHRTCTVLHQVFDFAEARGEVAANPIRALRRAYPHRPATHHAAITDPARFGQLLRAIDGCTGHLATRYALRLLPLVFVRSAELRGAEWSEFDLDAAVWTIPAARMKRKKNGAHVVPLARQAVAILRELHTHTGERRLLFPGARSSQRPLSNATLGAALATLGFVSNEHTPHGFRTSASTNLNSLAAAEGGKRFNFEHVEAQLAHRPSDAVRDAYQRAQFISQRAALMQAWGDLCDEMKERTG